LEIEGGDVDHLVVAPWGVVGIDSKWHTGKFDSSSVQRDCDRALAATRRARSILRSLQCPTEVSTVVAIWGAQQEDVPAEGTLYNGVTVLRGRGIKRWLRAQRSSSATISPSAAGSLLLQLNEFRARVRPT